MHERKPISVILQRTVWLAQIAEANFRYFVKISAIDEFSAE